MKRACLLLLPALLLAVLVGAGCNDESQPVITRLSVTPGCGVVPLEVEGYAIVSGGNETGDPGGANNLLEMTWNFGDGGTATSSLAYHRYDLPGDYNVVVTAKDADGNTTSASTAVRVLADSLLISASSNFPDGNVAVGQRVQFDMQAESCSIAYPDVPGDSVKMTFRWEMGDADGTVYDGAAPGFIYTVPGDYDVHVAVGYPALAVTRRDTLHFTVTGP